MTVHVARNRAGRSALGIVAATLLVLLGPASDASGQSFEIVHAFEPAPWPPVGGLVEMPDGSFFGIARHAIFRWAAGSGLSFVHHLDDGTSATGSLIRGSDGMLYGTTSDGGSRGHGTVFSFDPATRAFRTLHAFGSESEGWAPRRGLVEVGAFLYGVTGSDGPIGATLYRVDRVTGAVETILRRTPETGQWFGGLTAADGVVYITGAPSVSSVDSATGAYNLLANCCLFGPVFVEPVTRTADGWIYVTARQSVGEAIYALPPASGAPGPIPAFLRPVPLPGAQGGVPSRLVEAADGHLYGVAAHDPQAGDAAHDTIFRLRRLPDGEHAFEPLRDLEPGTADGDPPIELTLGSDGRIYGYAQSGGPSGAGGLYRFDPLERGGPLDPLQFEVLETIPRTVPGWNPSHPVQASDGFLYGTTSLGGATGRGTVYRLDPESGVATMLGPVPGPLLAPGALWTPVVSNSTLLQAADGKLYGTSTTRGADLRIVRVDPATGLISTALETTGEIDLDGILRTPAGGVYLVSRMPNGFVIQRFDPATDSLTATVTFGSTTEERSVRVTAGLDGNFYYVYIYERFRSFRSDTRLARLDASTGAVTLLHVWPTQSRAPEIMAAADGSLRVALGTLAGGGVGTRIVAVDAATGDATDVCAGPVDGAITGLSGAPDGSLFWFSRADAIDRLFRCDAATGAIAEVHAVSPSEGVPTTTQTTSPPAVVAAPLTAADGRLYGATHGGLTGGGTIFRIVPSGSLPIPDTDGDGLPDAWELTYGLDPSSSIGVDGASGDADRDGVTNAAEYAAGTHPRASVVRHLAEGATGPFFHTRLAMANPTFQSANVLVRFFTDAGAVIPWSLAVSPRAERTVDVGTVAGLEHASFSMVIESDQDLAVDRTMSWGAGGRGSHAETAGPAAATTWYFAEGSTSSDFALFYLLLNAQAAPVTATVAYLRPFGRPPVTRVYVLPPHSRTTIAVDGEGPELASTDVAATVTATLPIFVERAMYLSRPGQSFTAGHASAGVTSPAMQWYLAEGATGPFFDMFLLVANPNPTAAEISVDYLRGSDGVLTKTYVVPGQGRLTIWVDDEELPVGSGQKPLANEALSLAVRSTNGVSIVAERTMWWPGPEISPSSSWYEAHNSPGATAPAARWVIAGTQTGGANDAQAWTYILIANVSASPVPARITALFEDGTSRSQDLALPAQSRTNVDARGLGRGRFGVIVESLGMAPPALVVERSTYASPGGVTWASGSNALAAPIP